MYTSVCVMPTSATDKNSLSCRDFFFFTVRQISRKFTILSEIFPEKKNPEIVHQRRCACNSMSLYNRLNITCMTSASLTMSSMKLSQVVAMSSIYPKHHYHHANAITTDDGKHNSNFAKTDTVAILAIIVVIVIVDVIIIIIIIIIIINIVFFIMILVIIVKCQRNFLQIFVRHFEIGRGGCMWMNYWLTGWMHDEWMVDGCMMNGWWMDAWWMDNGWMDEWMDGCMMNGWWMDGWMDGWRMFGWMTDVWMDGWMDD